MKKTAIMIVSCIIVILLSGCSQKSVQEKFCIVGQVSEEEHSIITIKKIVIENNKIIENRITNEYKIDRIKYNANYLRFVESRDGKERYLTYGDSDVFKIEYDRKNDSIKLVGLRSMLVRKLFLNDEFDYLTDVDNKGRILSVPGNSIDVSTKRITENWSAILTDNNYDLSITNAKFLQDGRIIAQAFGQKSDKTEGLENSINRNYVLLLKENGEKTELISKTESGLFPTTTFLATHYTYPPIDLSPDGKKLAFTAMYGLPTQCEEKDIPKKKRYLMKDIQLPSGEIQRDWYSFPPFYLSTIEIESGKVEKICRLSNEFFPGCKSTHLMSWNPNVKLPYSIVIFRTFHPLLVNMKTGEYEKISLENDDSAPWIDYMKWFPDGKKAGMIMSTKALPGGKGSGILYVYDLKEKKTILQIKDDFEYVGFFSVE